jgi:phage protein
MNKHEAIKKVEQMGEYERFVNESIPKLSVLNILNQLDEPQKLVVPQFVADYIEFQKTYNFHVYGAMRTIEDHYDKRVPNWFYEGNIEKFCLAWINGYEIEKEKRYMVSLRNGQPLVKTPLGKDFYFNQNIKAENCKVTRKELEQAGFGWVFDCPGVEIEEVER